MLGSTARFSPTPVLVALRPRPHRKGHKGHFRIRRSEVDCVRRHAPSSCSRCESEVIAIGQVRRHQQTEFVEGGAVQVIEHQRPLMRCIRCGHRERAALPEEVQSYGAFGPRLRALMVTLVSGYRLSRRQVQRFLREVFCVRVSLGAVASNEKRMSQALGPVYQDALQAAQSSAQAHADETPWFTESKLNWLWVLATKQMSVFRIDAKRDTEAAKKLLGGFKGLLCSDDLGSYNTYDKARRQLCHAHLARHIQKHIDCAKNKRERKLAMKLSKLHRKIFRLWNLIRDGTIAAKERRIKMGHIEDAFTATLQKGAKSAHKRFANFCQRQLTRTPMLWRFVLYQSEPTNNTAERALRHAVIWRKTSFGTQSDHGNRFAERILTVHHCLRLQGRNMLSYLTRVLKACALRVPLPSLRPGSIIGAATR